MFKKLGIFLRQVKYSFYNLYKFGVFSSNEDRLIAHGLACCIAKKYNLDDAGQTLVVVVDPDDIAYLIWKSDLAKNDQLKHLVDNIRGALSILKQHISTKEEKRVEHVNTAVHTFGPPRTTVGEEQEAEDEGISPWKNEKAEKTNMVGDFFKRLNTNDK